MEDETRRAMAGLVGQMAIIAIDARHARENSERALAEVLALKAFIMPPLVATNEEGVGE